MTACAFLSLSAFTELSSPPIPFLSHRNRRNKTIATMPSLISEWDPNSVAIWVDKCLKLPYAEAFRCASFIFNF